LEPKLIELKRQIRKQTENNLMRFGENYVPLQNYNVENITSRTLEHLVELLSAPTQSVTLDENRDLKEQNRLLKQSVALLDTILLEETQHTRQHAYRDVKVSRK
jgi:hypothetical protein